MGSSKPPGLGMPRLMAFCYRCKSDPNVYLKLIHGYFIIIVLYLDDLMITGILRKEIGSLKDAMNHAFSMIDLGLLSQFLGLKINQVGSSPMVNNTLYR